MKTDFQSELDTYLRARCSLIIVHTPEEERLLDALRSLCEGRRQPCVSWDLGDGFLPVTPGAALPEAARDPLTALERIDLAKQPCLFVLKDFHEAWSNPQVRRKLRSVSQRLKFTTTSIVISTPGGKIPGDLKDEALRIDFPAPGESELSEVLQTLTQTPNLRVNLTPLGREKMVQAALGLTAAQARRVFAKAVVANGTLDDRDIDAVTREKKQVIAESEALEFYPVTESPDNVGGLGALKDWLLQRERAFSQEARDYGLPSPKGISLIGIPGTGKSLTAKMIGGLWRLPLVRLDVGALFGGLVGESEENTRRALKLAETVAPCVLWIDEMEKAFAQGGLDGGTSARVFGSILTWMAEKTAPCFVVATANDIEALPPELLRKGRFDEVFFLDLPTYEERREIIRVHLRRKNRDPRAYDVDQLARQCEGHVGAEIEQAVIDAMYAGFNDGCRDFTTTDIARAIAGLVPLCRAQKPVIEHLRGWLRDGRAKSASYQGLSEAGQQAVPLSSIIPIDFSPN